MPYYLRNLLLAQADASVQELLQDLDNLLEMLPKAHSTSKPALEVDADADEEPATMLYCDVNGKLCLATNVAVFLLGGSKLVPQTGHACNRLQHRPRFARASVPTHPSR